MKKKKFNYLIVYSWNKKEYSKELKYDFTNTGYGNSKIVGDETLSVQDIKDITTGIVEMNKFDSAVILNIIKLNEV